MLNIASIAIIFVFTPGFVQLAFSGAIVQLAAPVVTQNDEHSGVVRSAESGDGFDDEAFERAAEESAFPVPPPFDPASLEEIERAKYTSYQAALAKNGNQFSTEEELAQYVANTATVVNKPEKARKHSYGSGRLKGTWHQKHLALDSVTGPSYSEGGFRADGAVYDSLKDDLYVVSHSGHLYKIEPRKRNKWSLRNHHKNLRGFDLNGVNLKNGKFRLLHQSPNGPMEFSDDEGRTWANANGALFENGKNFNTLVAKRGKLRRIVAHGGRYLPPSNALYHRVYISNDYGLKYFTSKTLAELSMADFEVRCCRPHNSSTVYCFVRRKKDSVVALYQMAERDKDFVSSGQRFKMKGLDRVVGTEVDGVAHFYISYKDTDIFYSGDGGKTWRQTSDSKKEQNLQDVHPTKPNICFRGFVDLHISTDFGATWTAGKHKFEPAPQRKDKYYIWDVQCIRTFESKKRGHITFVGTDFGSYYSFAPEDWSSWTSINRGSPNMLCYDAATSEKHRRVYSANQDRGAQSFLDSRNSGDRPIPCLREANSDLLRVSIAKGGDSAWFWYYYGTIGRAPVQGGGDYGRVVKKNFYAKFSATSMIPSPDVREDAVYIPWDKQLHKISFNGKQIVRTMHPHVFPEDVWSFGYSAVNTKRWYAGLKSGRLMHSNDGGESFKPSNHQGPWPKQESGWRKTRSVIATSPVDENTVYYAGKGNVFLVSRDGGETFTNQNAGLKVRRISDLDVSKDGRFVFAAGDFDGAWVFLVKQKKWFKMEGDEVPKLLSFSDVQFIDATNTARFATYGSGILDFKISGR
jgi:hypothetical protein